MRLRVATYNIHKCRGLDRRVAPERIADVLRDANADLIALQEVVSLRGRAPADDQPAFLAQQLGYACVMGSNRRIRHADYGNAILSRLPIRAYRNLDISWKRNERRGCLRADVELPGGATLHFFNVHLGTAWLERRHQARALVGPAVLGARDFSGPRILLGDLNEWTRGLATRTLAAHMHAVDIRPHLRRRRTYPGIFPVLHLDHIYFDPPLRLERVELVRTRMALIASDHLPIVAEFSLKEDQHG